MIDVFLCGCGTNIASAVDLDRVEAELHRVQGVRVHRDTFLCSREGQSSIREAVGRGGVDAVVVAACSPKHHGDVFRAAVAGAVPVDGSGGGVEIVMANVREQCAWVTPSREDATAKALALVRAALARARLARPLGAITLPVERAVAVVGGGVAGMHAALALAAMGLPVHLIERSPSLGGVMAQLDRTFPTDDCAMCSIAPVLSEVASDPRIRVHAMTEVRGMEGRPGAWGLELETRPRHVSLDRCTACGECLESGFEPPAPKLAGGRVLVDRISVDAAKCTLCGACVGACTSATGGAPALSAEGGRLSYDTRRCTGCWECLGACTDGALRRVAVCPVVVPREADAGLGWRGAIHMPAPHAVPRACVRDPGTCLALTGELPCVGCERACPAGAIEVGTAQRWRLDVGAVVIATGAREAGLEGTEYHPEHPDVVSALELERLLSPDGPTGGELLRPSDGRRPRRVVFVQCAGSRSQAHYPHCSRVCCSQAVKNAKLIRSTWPDTDVTVCYTDLRVSGRDAEERYDRARGAGVRFLRGLVAEVDAPLGGPLVVRTEDTLAGGGRLDLEADLVVLSTALLPSEGTAALAEALRVPTDPLGFLRPVHPKMRPVDTSVRGVFIAGSAESPKFVQECIAEAGAAAQRAGGLVAAGSIEVERAYPDLDVERCIGCGACIGECPFGAIEATPDGRVRIVEAACRACGKCASACPSSALDLRELPDSQLRAEVDAMLEAALGSGRLDAPVVAYSCSSCGYNAADLAGSRRLSVPSSVLPVWVPCSGRLSVEDLLHPFTRGASAVLVAACLPDGCSFVDGNAALEGRLARAREMLSLSGIDPARLALAHVSSADAEGFSRAARDMAARAGGGRGDGGREDGGREGAGHGGTGPDGGDGS